MKNIVIAREPQSGERSNHKPIKFFYIFFVMISCFVFSLSGCATTGDYKLRAGDELRIVIWQELDEKAVIRPDYKISLPLVGEVSCKDKTPEKLSRELTQMYELETVVMVSKYQTIKQDLKDLFGFIRDLSFAYFLGHRIIKD
jgi:protein involved in polysaccharide export with SLBB domain